MSTAIESVESTDQVEQVETSSSVDLSVVSPGSRAVGSMPSVPDVPKALVESKKPFARAMVGSFSALVGMARDALAVIQRYYQGTAELDKQLTESDNAIVVKYRQALAQAATELKASEDKYNADIAPFIAARKARDEVINKHVADFKAPAVAELGGQIGVTLDEANDAKLNYKAAADGIKSNVATLKRQGIDLGEYGLKPLKGNGSRGTGEFTPRFQTATIDGTPVTPDAKGKVTPVQVAAALGITRDQVVKLLLIQSLNGDRSVFDSAAPHSAYEFNANGKHVTVTKGERKSPAKASANGAVDSVDTDDDDDDDEE